jgi:hypothetical protein
MQVAGPRAQLEFPRDADALYLVYGMGSRSVVAELYGLPDRAVRIVLPVGRYIVQKRVGGAGGAADVTLAAGATRVLMPGEFRAFESDALARKGALVVRPWSLELYDGATIGREVDFSGEVSVRVARRDTYAFALGPLAASRRTRRRPTT